MKPFHKSLNILILIGTITLIIASFMAEIRIALYNLAMGVTIFSILLKYIFFKEIGNSFSKKSLACFGVIFIVYCIGTLISGDQMHESLTYISQKSKWIIIPAIFYLTTFNLKEKYILLFTFSFISFLICVYVIYNYTIYENSSDFIKSTNMDDGKIPSFILPFRILHHFFSIIMTCTSVFLISYISNNFNVKSYISWLIILVTILFVYSIHISGARIGMLALYISVFFILITQFKDLKKAIYLLSISIIASILIFTIGYKTSFNFKSRVDNTITELKYIAVTDVSEMTDIGNFTVRIVSFKTVFPLLKKNIYTGIGAYGFEKNLLKYFDQFKNLSLAQKAFPPNQWIRNSLSFGLPLALISFLLLIFIFIAVKKTLIFKSFALLTPILMFTMTETPLDYRGSYFFIITYLPLSLILMEIISEKHNLKPSNENLL